MNNKTVLTPVIILTCIIVCVCGIKNPADSESESLIPNYVLFAPVEVKINGDLFKLETDLWRDFMPEIPPGGSRLIACVFITLNKSETFPDNINADRLWVINGEEFWETAFSDEQIYHSKHQLAKIARDGPKWEVKIKVDVVVRIIRNNKHYYIKAYNQLIGATW